jgi:hypothetical protein
MISEDGNYCLYPESHGSHKQEGPHFENRNPWKHADYAALLPITDERLKVGNIAEYAVVRFMVFGCISK